MKFWNQLRRIGTWVMGVIAMVTLVMSVMHTPEADDAFAPTTRPAAASPRGNPTTGL